MKTVRIIFEIFILAILAYLFLAPMAFITNIISKFLRKQKARKGNTI